MITLLLSPRSCIGSNVFASFYVLSTTNQVIII
uniref:Uncharacterized protein n=1 Tax=Lepeophtheirus salmonis TaxID=72036 RepID=A0A0K2TV67_LEPSM